MQAVTMNILSVMLMIVMYVTKAVKINNTYKSIKLMEMQNVYKHVEMKIIMDTLNILRTSRHI